MLYQHPAELIMLRGSEDEKPSRKVALEETSILILKP
jgi:hypothetical protein